MMRMSNLCVLLKRGKNDTWNEMRVNANFVRDGELQACMHPLLFLLGKFLSELCNTFCLMSIAHSFAADHLLTI